MMDRMTSTKGDKETCLSFREGEPTVNRETTSTFPCMLCHQPLRRCLMQALIQLAAGQQFRMGADGFDAALIEHDDPVGDLQHLQPVGDDKRGAALHELLHGPV